MSSIPMYPSTREEAIATNSPRYFTGQPCKHGHIAPRLACNNNCTECVRIRNEKRRAQDPSKVHTMSVDYHNRLKTNMEYVQRRMLARSKSRASSLGLDFDLDLEYIQQIWPEDNKCPVFHVELEYGSRNAEYSASLDRIIPALGYTKGNVCIISMRANRIKYNATLDEMRCLVTYMDHILEKHL